MVRGQGSVKVRLRLCIIFDAPIRAGGMGANARPTVHLRAGRRSALTVARAEIRCVAARCAFARPARALG